MKSSRIFCLVGRAVLTVFVSSTLVLACSGDDDGQEKGSSSGTIPASSAAPKDPLNASPGTLGGACDSDASCTSGLKCITPAGFSAGAKYCAPTCNGPADCETFAKTSFSIPIPLDPDGFGPNQWNRTVLERGVACDASPDVPGGAKYCQFFCPENSAIEDQAKGCQCLPRYKPVKTADGKLIKCEWDDQSVCSIVVYPGRRNVCDACNSKPVVDGCYTGDYRCAVNRSFNGTCYQWSNVQTLDACIAQATSDCDEACYENCAGSGESSSPGVATSSNCVNLCCKSSTRPATQPPACQGTPTIDGGSSSRDAASCTAAPVFNCGTSSAGTLACTGGQVCCLSPGCDPTAANPYMANGAVSRCVAPASQSGAYDRCPAPAIQLCATAADCGAGYDCDPAAFYCKPKSGSAVDGGR